MAQGCERVSDVALGAQDCRAGCNPREGQEPGGVRSFFGGAGFTGGDPLADQEALGGNTERGMMMKAEPALRSDQVPAPA
jgi:hypothetical protein